MREVAATATNEPSAVHTPYILSKAAHAVQSDVVGWTGFIGSSTSSGPSRDDPSSLFVFAALT